MGLIDIIKPLSSVLSSAINKSRQHQEKTSCECQELNRGLGKKQLCYLCTSVLSSPILSFLQLCTFLHCFLLCCSFFAEKESLFFEVFMLYILCHKMATCCDDLSKGSHEKKEKVIRWQFFCFCQQLKAFCNRLASVFWSSSSESSTSGPFRTLSPFSIIIVMLSLLLLLVLL